MALKRYELNFFFFIAKLTILVRKCHEMVMALKRKELPLIDES